MRCAVSGESIRASVEELAGAGVDVIFATRVAVIRAAKEATSEIPIVMVASGDPVADGLVVGLAQPGGNVTGLTSLVQDLGSKRLELIKETIPRLSRVAVLWNPAETESAIGVGGAHAAAERLGLRLTTYEIRQRPRQVDVAFERWIARASRR